MLSICLLCKSNPVIKKVLEIYYEQRKSKAEREI